MGNLNHYLAIFIDRKANYYHCGVAKFGGKRKECFLLYFVIIVVIGCSVVGKSILDKGKMGGYWKRPKLVSCEVLQQILSYGTSLIVLVSLLFYERI